MQPGTLIDGRYKVVRFIGSGGNGAVHEVEHILTGRRLALKSLIDDSGYGRLEQEARATSLMKNPHAVKITDMGTMPQAGPYIVMELLEGQSLRALLEETGQLPLELTVNMALQVCECLAEAHQHGIVHRDLKPDNVFLCPGANPGQYDVKVLDFGVVKIANDGPIPNSSLTRTGSTVGTPFYMSLEQLRNSSAVDQRADIYALGVVIYECLAGRKPYQAETIGDLVYALCSGPPTHLNRLRPDLPTELCDVVMKALATNREQRYGAMSELAQVLSSYGDQTFSQWLRETPKRSGVEGDPRGRSNRPSNPPRPGNMTPSSGGARPAEERRQQNVPVPIDRRAAADRRTVQLEIPAGQEATMAIPRPDMAPTVPRPPRPEPITTGDRDTPTEMYVKGRHGGVSLPGAEEAKPAASGRRDTPTRALEAPLGAFGAEPTLGPGGQPVIGPPSADPDPPRPQMQSQPFAAVADITSIPVAMPTEALPRMQSSPGMQPPQYLSTPGVQPLGAPKPAWQVSLDKALAGVGGFIERVVTGVSTKFRGASPRAQLVIVIASASGLAALIVLTVYLIVR